ncbi:T9SS type A sorting domain-containing protein [Salibacter halophilus]|uniref:T9SS type A sorting domain-containing protein n=1 Tax=Salibacter halophilus TaxID=1803916 RepID=A0A6N6MDY5_9FLAO|nr:T9SS type A sorting domain-containing protein [Salibacter halophilus]KAB1065925.1 T9SS type A sorting domain-containing protein [Salibacter halophilus]
MRKRLLCLIALFAAINSFASIVYVDINATGAENGSSWNDAFVNLHHGLNNANQGDSIWVAQGVYLPSDDSTRNVYFQVVFDSIYLFGGFAGNETSLDQRDFISNQTILSGDLYGNDNPSIDPDETTRSDNTYHVLYVGGVKNTVIDGFTITGGNGNSSAWPNNQGGGIYLSEHAGDIKILNCNITKNSSSGALAAIRTKYTQNEYREFVLDNCLITNNTTANVVTGVTLTGGSGLALVSNCLFANNKIEDNSQYTGKGGSAIRFYQASNDVLDVQMTNCTVISNVEDGTNPSPIVVGEASGIINFLASNNLVDNNTNATSTFGTGVVSNCPNTVELINNIRPDHSTTFCNGTSNGEFHGSPQLGTDYVPTDNSPAVNAGNNLYVLGSYDYYGTNRIESGTVDIGAFESVQSCAITGVSIDSVYCSTSGSSYSVDLTVTYEYAPSGGTLEFDGAGVAESFSIDGSPQMITVNNISESESPNFDLHFSNEATCSYSDNNAWTVPNCNTTGVSNILNSVNYSVYPNPGNGVFQLEIEGDIESYNAQVFNLLGEMVFESRIQSSLTTINLDRFTNGVYLLQISDGQNVYTEKLIKR